MLEMDEIDGALHGEDQNTLIEQSPCSEYSNTIVTHT